MQSSCVVFPLLLLVATTSAGELRCLRPGAPVISLYRDGRYFPGRLDGLGESIDVTFQNGQQQSYSSFTNDVIVDDVPDAVELEGGSRVLARRPSSISFEPGFVNGSIEGLPLNDTYLVNFDNGDSIARSIRDIRLAVKPRSCMNEKGIYIGCFENVVNNFLTNYYPVNPTDVATCNWACFTRGFRFAGLQNGTWCFCGNHVNDTLKVDDNDCNIACRDSREDVCGGYQRMTVYWTGAEYENSTDDFSDFPDSKSPLTSEEDLLKTESSTENACTDLYDSTQCNTWADQSKCIENPDWMIANCKKSCYACGYDDHEKDKSDSSPQTNTPDASSQARSQDSTYQSSAQSSSAKNSDHPGLENMSNTPGYLGCFQDSPSSHDLEYLADIRPLSIRACVTKCKSLRFPYAAAQSSSSCYCGLHYGKYGQLEHEDCNTPCDGDSSEMCGGIYKNSLYNTGFPTKFKSQKDSASNSPTKTPPTSPYSGSNTANSRPYQSNPSTHYSSQYQQPAYPQQNAGYTPPVYRPPASSYTQATTPGQPGYPQTSNTPSNGYQPAYAYNNQASSGYSNQANNPVLSGAANAYTRDYSPVDSSSYRWRETYVKLRQQEQARFSQPNLKNLRRLHKSEDSQRKNHGNSNHEKRPKGSSNFKTLENNERAKSVSQALYGQLMSQMKKKSQGGNSKNLRKDAKPHHHKFEKPGVFLRKKASKKNSFLAFLPHEVTENESLLQNVYNMLSVMLKNLRKHKKSSLKNLRKYLKFSKSKAPDPEPSKKAPLHTGDHKESVDRSEDPASERKVVGLSQSQTSKPRGMGMRGKTKETSSSHLKETVKNNPSEGQKQLSKQEKSIPSSGEQMPSGQAKSTSRETKVKSYASRANANQSMRPSKNSGLIGNTAQSHLKDANKLSQSQPNTENVSGEASQAQSKLPSSWQPQGHVMPSDVSRNVSAVISKNESQDKPEVGAEERSEDPKMSKHASGGQEITNSYNLQPPDSFPKVGSNFQLSKHDDSFENGLSGGNIGLEKKLVKDISPKSTENSNETLKKEESWTSKTKSKTKLKANSTITNDQTPEETVDGNSDEDIISTIVNMIEREKAARNRSSERELTDGKRRHGFTGRKRKQKRHSKSRKHKKVKEKRKLRQSKHKDASDMKRIYKKDHIERVMDEDKQNDDNLMMEDEYFREKNKIDE